MEETTMNNSNNSHIPTFWLILRTILGVAAVILLVISMITDRQNAYLTLGLCFVAFAHVINWITGCKGYNCFNKHTHTED